VPLVRKIGVCMGCYLCCPRNRLEKGRPCADCSEKQYGAPITLGKPGDPDRPSSRVSALLSTPNELMLQLLLKTEEERDAYWKN
jgi:hypothetical protein